MFTSHGHQIFGTTAELPPDDMLVARCGGPGLCKVCSAESASVHGNVQQEKEIRMSIESMQYVRKPFYVDAVQVTAENFNEVAEWCNGEVRTDVEKNQNFIHVRVHRPMNDRQTRAFVGDWILYAGNGYKVYTNKAFTDCFEPNTIIAKELGTKQLNSPKPRKPSNYQTDKVVSQQPVK